MQPDHLHNNQRNLPRTVQISFWFKTCFFGRHKNTHCVSLVNLDSSLLMPKKGLRWPKLLVNLALSLLSVSFFFCLFCFSLTGIALFCIELISSDSKEMYNVPQKSLNPVLLTFNSLKNPEKNYHGLHKKLSSTSSLSSFQY